MLKSEVCSRGQFDSNWYRAWCARMAEMPARHRKQWERCYIAQAAHERGMLQPGLRGLGFGVGREPLPALFASHGCTIVATDADRAVTEVAGWTRDNQDAGGLGVVNDRGLCSADEFARLTSYRSVDMNAIPRDLVDFDFVWSACSLEHLGSVERGKAFIYRSMDCLKIGGLAAHTAEYDRSLDSASIEPKHLALYRHQDIEEIVRMLREAGHYVEVDYSGELRAADPYMDLPAYGQASSLRSHDGADVVTSVGLIIEKGERVWSTGESGVDEIDDAPVKDAAAPDSTGLDEETARALVREAFLRVLNRPVDPQSETHFAAAIKNGFSREQLIAFLTDSAEFQVSRGNLAWLERLDADIIVSLKACEQDFGPLRMQGPARDELVFRAILAAEGIWERHLTTILAHALRPGDTFIDVGANLGYFSILAGARVGPWGRVLAFEPQPVAYPYCEANIRLNFLENIVVLPYALLDRREARSLWTPRTELGGAFLIPDDASAYVDRERETVQCLPFDDLITSGEVQVPACHIVKIDIQGSEPLALRGMEKFLRATRPALLVELATLCLATYGNTPRTFLELIDELGYVPMIVPRGRELEEFNDLPNVSPWGDVEIRAVPSIDRFVQVIEFLDVHYPPCYTADLIAVPREVDIRTGNIHPS